MTEGEAQERHGNFSPPYLSFETFRNFIARLGERKIPPRIDRSMMIGIAGGTQTYLLQALRAFDLIDASNGISPRLVQMATDEAACATEMRGLLQHFYADQLALSAQHATAGQLSESFDGYGLSGSTLRKAITFFLHMARFAELPLSPHFRAPQQRTGSPRPRRASSPGRKRVAPEPGVDEIGGTSAAQESHTVALASGGTITLSCSVAFLALTREDRAFVFDLVDRLQHYQGTKVVGADNLVGAVPQSTED